MKRKTREEKNKIKNDVERETSSEIHIYNLLHKFSVSILYIFSTQSSVDSQRHNIVHIIYRLGRNAIFFV